MPPAITRSRRPSRCRSARSRGGCNGPLSILGALLSPHAVLVEPTRIESVALVDRAELASTRDADLPYQPRQTLHLREADRSPRGHTCACVVGRRHQVGGHVVKPVRVLGLVCALLACARSSPAQQSVDLASISGRVVDPSGAVVRGAEVTARHVDTNVTAKAATDAEGRFRFPYLKIGPYIVTVRQPGFRDAAQSLTLSAGAAFELPISLGRRRRGRGRHCHRRDHRPRGGAQPDCRDHPGRGGAQPAAERPQLPRRRAARARRFTDQRPGHADVP